MPKKLTQNEFINRCQKIYGDKYDYLQVEYQNLKTPVDIHCRKHGNFKQRPNNLLFGHGIFEQRPEKHAAGFGCWLCSGKYKKTNKIFKEDILRGEVYASL